MIEQMLASSIHVFSGLRKLISATAESSKLQRAVVVLHRAHSSDTAKLGQFTMLELDEKWAPVLLSQPETGMGYQITTVVLRDGSRIDQVRICGGIITDIAGCQEIPFEEEEIADIVVTHGK